MHGPFHHDDLLKQLERIDMRAWQLSDARLRMQKAALILGVLLDLAEGVRAGGRRVRTLLGARPRQPERLRTA